MPWFIDVTDDSDLTIEPVDNCQPITDSENETIRKENKRATKKKMQLNNLHAPIRALAASSTTRLLFCPAFVSCLGSFAPLLSYFTFLTYLLPLLACLGNSTILLSSLMPTLVLGSLAV